MSDDARTTERTAAPRDESRPASTASDRDPGRHDTPVSERYAAFMREGWGELPEPSSPPSPPPSLTAERRARLLRALPGQPLVIPAGTPPTRTNDQSYLFRPNSDYVWLTGDQSPTGALLLTPDATATLYLVPPSRRDNGDFFRDSTHGELWVGRRPALDTRAAELGLDCRPLAELPTALAKLAGSSPRVLRGVDPKVERQVPETDPDRDDELRTVLHELRLVKDSWEIQQLRAAIAATTLGFRDVARALRVGTALTERHIEATFEHRARVEGNGVGYHSIAAAGPHATILHWNRNDGPVRAGETLLLDAGAETTSLYTADITRTMPVSGRFTTLQREVYERVLAAQNAAMATLRAGRPFRDYHRESTRLLAEGLADLGLLPVSAAESLRPDHGLHRRYTLCAPGHMLGLDVHDCAKARASSYLEGTLVAGEVLTVEPGLYFQANDETVPEELRGLGVRVEDDVLITEDGFELLSDALPRAAEDVEEWLSDPSGWRPSPSAERS